MKIIAGILIVAVIALIVGFIPIMEVPFTETVQYLLTEKYYEIVPDVQVYHQREPEFYGGNSRGSYEGIREVEKEYTIVWDKKVEKERVVIRERPETHYEKVPLLEYLLSKY